MAKCCRSCQLQFFRYANKCTSTMKNLEVMLKIAMTLENQNVCKLKTNWSEPEPNNELWTNKMIVHNFQRAFREDHIL